MDLQELIKSANNGDVVAMYKVFEYYHENNQHDMAEEWLYKSADYGYLKAIYVAVAYTIFNASILMKLEAFNEALEIYNKGINYLSILFKKENGVSDEILDDLIEKDYYNEFIIGIASCLIVTESNKQAYRLLENQEETNENKVLKGLAMLRMNDGYDTDKIGFSLLKTIILNENLKLDDMILTYVYAYLLQGYVRLSLETTGCSSRNEAIEKAYYIALNASRKGGHAGSICKDMLSHFRKKTFGGYEYID